MDTQRRKPKRKLLSFWKSAASVDVSAALGQIGAVSQVGQFGYLEKEV